MDRPAQILIVDDELAMREGLAECLRDAKYHTFTCEDVTGAVSVLENESVDLVITDLVMEPRDGMELLEHVKKTRPRTPVIMMSGYSTVATAVEAMRRGAFDYVPKPFDLDEVRLTVQHALETIGLEQENRRLKRQLEALRPSPTLIGESPRMRALMQLIDQVAPSDIPVLISGETGTGKELLAQEIHRRSRRASEPFLSVNCAALPETLLESELFGHVRGAFTGAVAKREGLFEAANAGTLFLDEIGDINQSAQASLLRVLQDGEIRRVGEARPRYVNVRIVAATNQHLPERIRTKQFREDLYYRLNVASLSTPPLRKRREDIPQLAEHFLGIARREMGLAPLQLADDARDALLSYAWPGNVRELENVMKRTAVICRTESVRRRDLPQEITNSEQVLPAHRSLADMERIHIGNVLESVDGNISQAARILGISRPTLRSKIHKYVITRPHDGPMHDA